MKDKTFAQNLLAWYRKNARDLPWRRTSDPYKIWISEIMLQQTTVNAVIPYYERWIKAFARIQDVAEADLQTILTYWQGLGYYQRAKNIHKSAQAICQHYHGKIPDDPLILKKLPGFGPYTIGAVLSIAFSKRVPIIDANVRRFVMRLLAIQGHADPSQDEKILDFIEDVMPVKAMNFFNQALMEMGALVCRSNEPVCILCPVKSNCLAYQKGIQELIPTAKVKDIKDIQAVIAVLQKGNQFYIQKRPSKGLLADLWEFPGGKIERGETSQQALARELKEELNTKLVSSSQIMNVQHFYTEFRVKLNVFSCQVKESLHNDPTHQWVTLEELKKYPMPSGSAKIVEKLKQLHARSSREQAEQLLLEA